MPTIKKYAIRSTAGWSANQAAMEAIYGIGNYYTSLSAFEAVITGNLVTADEQWICEFYNDWPSGLDDSVNMTAFTCDATRNIIFRAAEGEGNYGVWDAGFYISRSMADYIIKVRGLYTEIHDIQITNTSTSNGRGIQDNAGYLTVTNSIIDCGSNTTQNINSSYVYGLLMTGSLLYNCIAKGATVGFYVRNWGSHAPYVYNCTNYSTQSNSDTHGFVKGSSALPNFINCVSYNSQGTAFFQRNTGGSWSTSTNNASDDTSVTTYSIGTITTVSDSDFTDTSTNDYSLPSDSILVDEGYDLSGTFTTDITGGTRDATFDIGAFEYIAGLAFNTIKLRVPDTYTTIQCRVPDTYTTIKWRIPA